MRSNSAAARNPTELRLLLGRRLQSSADREDRGNRREHTRQHERDAQSAPLPPQRAGRQQADAGPQDRPGADDEQEFGKRESQRLHALLLVHGRERVLAHGWDYLRAPKEKRPLSSRRPGRPRASIRDARRRVLPVEEYGVGTR